MLVRTAIASVFCVFLAGLLPSAANAQSQDTVRELLSDCERALMLERQALDTVEDAISITRCVSTIQGITTVMAYACWASQNGFSPQFAAAPPPTVEASVQAFVNYARANPAIWTESSYDGVIGAMMIEFPCDVR